MSGIKISELDAITSLADADLFPVSKSDGMGGFISKKITKSNSIDLVNDTTPQLGGNLDVNGNTITSVSNGDVKISPNGSGTVDLDNKVLRQPLLKDVGEPVNALGSVTGATSIDMTSGNVVSATITGATQFTVTNPTATGNNCSFTLFLTNGGSQTITWMTGTKWASASPPILTSSGLDILAFTTNDGGTTWYGVLIGAAFA